MHNFRIVWELLYIEPLHCKAFNHQRGDLLLKSILSQTHHLGHRSFISILIEKFEYAERGVQSVYGPENKQKTETVKTAKAEKKAAKHLALQCNDPTIIWGLGQRQPWADRQVKPAGLTEEQLG